MPAIETLRTLSNASLQDFSTDLERSEAIEACQALLTRLEDPFQRVWKAVVDYPALVAALKFCLDIDLFRVWKEAGNGDQSCHDLARMVAYDRVGVLGRLLKHLAAHAIIEEVGVHIYRPTGFSDAMLCSTKAGIEYYYDTSARLYLSLPGYYQKCGIDPLSDPRDGLFQHTFDCRGQTAFERYGMPEHQEQSRTFNDWLAAYRHHRLPWFELYPSWNILDGYTGGPLIVDIGGNLGDDLELFKMQHPEHGSRLVLQDLPSVITHATCSDDIQRVAHDFFTAQPNSCRGARVYYLHSILHDWDDHHAQEILQHIRDAMLPGYSKLLINDVIMPTRRASRRDTSVNLHMMAKLGGRERTGEALSALVNGLGLRVRKIWSSDSSETSILEAELPL